MNEFSDDDQFHRGFIYATHLSNKGLILMPGEVVSIKELQQTRKRLRRIRDYVETLIIRFEERIERRIRGEEK